MYDHNLIGKKVKFTFIDEEYKSIHGDKEFEGVIVKRGCKNYIESTTDGTPEDIAHWGYDYYDLTEVTYEVQ